jgi:hypothetical protein
VTAIRRNIEQDGEDLLNFIEQGAGRVGKSVEIPSPDGQGQGGWTPLANLKVQPEVLIMLDQLREHKLFKGKWKTTSQVAWSMIYLGLRSCYQFWSQDQDEWKEYRSNFITLTDSLAEVSNLKRQDQLIRASRNFRTTIHAYLDKGTAFGKYRAWRVLESAMEARDVVEDLKQYDTLMRSPAPPALNGNLVFDNRVGEFWEKLYPVITGGLDEEAADALYIELTQDYFDELDALRAPQHED